MSVRGAVPAQAPAAKRLDVVLRAGVERSVAAMSIVSIGVGAGEEAVSVLPMTSPDVLTQNPDDVIRQLANMMLNGVVVSSYTDNVMLDIHKTAAKGHVELAGKKISSDFATPGNVSRGNSNEVLLVKTSVLSDKGKAVFYGVDRGNDPKAMIFRRSYTDVDRLVKPPTAEKAARELAYTGYAASRKLGPKLYAGYITPLGKPLLKDRHLTRVCMHMFTEAWGGSLYSALRRKSISAELFAEKLSQLLCQSHDAGFWHMDATPSNMLYRVVGSDIEICWTDFDPAWCVIWPHGVRDDKHCDVLVHASLIMGFISCQLGRDVFEFYQPVVREQLKRDFRTDLISDADMCAWLDDLEKALRKPITRRQKLPQNAESIAKLRIAGTLRRTLEHYLAQPPDPDKVPDHRCILKQNTNEDPTFAQFFKFALAEAGDPSIESWTTLSGATPTAPTPIRDADGS